MRALVTGGGGFLGKAVVQALLARGDEAVSISRSHYPALEAMGVPSVQADLGAGASPILRALVEHGVDTVFHCAAKPGVFGPAAGYEHANVAATQHVIAACLAAGVPRLVFTSSPSVVFDGQSHRNAGRDLPYPDRYLAHYPRTKAEAERLVLAANGAHSEESKLDLATVALRPHLIFGPGDPNLIPRLLARADAGKLRIVGPLDSEVSLSYVDNAAEAHLVAADALVTGGAQASCAGRAYFINNVEPVRLWDWINRVLKATGRPPVTRRVPASLAYAVGAGMEAAWRIVGAKSEPPMTRFVAKQLSTSHSYDMTPFVHDTGGQYVELVDIDEATERACETELDRRSGQVFETPSS